MVLRLPLGITRLRVHCRSSSRPCQATCQLLSMKLPHLTAPTRPHLFDLTRRSAPARRSMKTCSLSTSHVVEEGCSTIASRGDQRLGKEHRAAKRTPLRIGQSLNNSKVFRLSRTHSALMRLPAALLVLQAVRTARVSNAQPDDRAPSAGPLDRQKLLRCTASNKVRPQRMSSIISSTWTSAA